MPDGRDFLTEDMIFRLNARQILDRLTEVIQGYVNEKVESGKAEDIDYYDVERYILLKVTDEKWMDHIDNLEQLKQGVGLQAIGQHDPVVVYKQEGYEMFQKMNDDIQYSTIRFLIYANVKKSEKPPTVLQKVKIKADGAPIE